MFLGSYNWHTDPSQVIDVGKALQAIAYDDSTAGQTFELYGPKQYTMREIADIVDRDTVTKRHRINLPKPVLKTVAKMLDYVWWPTIAPDEVEREFLDQKIDPTAKTFADLQITPDDLETKSYGYLRHFRSV